MGDDEPPTPAQLQAEKEALKSENILTVIGSLHAILRNLWSFKVEAEEDLRITRSNRTAAHAGQVLALRAQMRDMEGALRQAQAAENEARIA